MGAFSDVGAGGVRGRHTASLGDHFDLIAGTSTTGIIAVGLGPGNYYPRVESAISTSMTGPDYLPNIGLQLQMGDADHVCLA